MRGQRAIQQVGNAGSVMSAFEAIRADYDMAKESRFRRRLTGYSPMGSGADYHYRSESDFLKMMELARSIDRNDIVVGQGVTRLVDNVLQGGFKLDPETGDADLDKILKEKWYAWCEDADACDFAGERDFNEIAETALRDTIVDGDQLFIPLKSGHIETMEAHRCRTPRNTKRNVVHGVLLDEVSRKRLEYWFTKENVDPLRQITAVSEIKALRARDAAGNRMVFHLHLAKRGSQTRGVSAFAPVVNAVGMHDDIQFAKLVQQQLVSMFAIIRERDPNGTYGPNPAFGSSEDETMDDGTTRTMTELAPGMEITAMPGEKITGFSPNIPNAEYFEHVKMILTFIAVNLGIPRHVLLLDPSDTNFSGWRGAIDQAKYGFRRLQRRMISKFYTPIYQWKVRQWIANDEIVSFAASKAGINVFKHCFIPPYWDYIEPNKDAEADVTIIGNRLNSRREQLGKRGLDIESVDRDACDDQANWIRLCLSKAKEINDEFPEAGITWRDIDAMVATKATAPQKQATDGTDATDGETQPARKEKAMAR